MSLYLFSLILAAACRSFCLSVFFDSFISLYNAFLGSFGEPSIFHLWNAGFVLLDAWPISSFQGALPLFLLFRLPFALWFGIAFSVLCVGRFPSASCLVLVEIWSCPFGILDFYLGMCRLSLSTFGRHIYSTLVSYIMLLLASFWIFSLSVIC